MARRRLGDKPLSESMLVSLLTHICVTRPQWVLIMAPNCMSFHHGLAHCYIVLILTVEDGGFQWICILLGKLIWWCGQNESSRLLRRESQTLFGCVNASVGHYKELLTQRPGSPKNTTQQHDVSVQSTLDGRPMYYSQNKNGPVESECKLNNVNPHIIRNQIQIK